jgi:CheY-like chemotaxis protein
MLWAQAHLSDMHCDVLVVEDDPDLRDALAELLRDEGFAVSTAENGVRALQHLEGPELPKVIVSDLMMPEMNGWELLDHVRGSDRLRKVPVLVMTAAAEPKVPADVPLVRKPIDIDDMTQRIASYCHS